MKSRMMIIVLLLLFCVVLAGCSSKTTDPCTQKLKTKGACEMLVYGYEYNLESGLCSKVQGSGCVGFSPFDLLNDCQLACEKEYNSESWKEIIPDSCTNFNDGCNNCNRAKGEGLAACTMMACEKYKRPVCLD
jgi:hypothetical protein